MILVNKNFGTPVLSSVIGDMFKASSDASMSVDWVPNTGTLASGSSLVATIVNSYGGNSNSYYSIAESIRTTFNIYNSSCQNFYIVTEKFIKILDKVYTKIWNESFTETGIYTPSNLATIYYGFVNNTSAGVSGPFMMFKKFVDRCITAGILVEDDRLDYQDQIFISGMSRSNMSTQVDTTNKLITFTHSTPIDINPDINAMEGQYLYGKKLYIMMTPYLTNGNIIQGGSSQEPFENYLYSWYDTYLNGEGTNVILVNAQVRRPLAFFKPKTDASKFGRSLPLGTHFFWSIGTPADKAAAELAGTTPPDLIFDHLDRISHIDSLVLKIKFDKLQF